MASGKANTKVPAIKSVAATTPSPKKTSATDAGGTKRDGKASTKAPAASAKKPVASAISAAKKASPAKTSDRKTATRPAATKAAAKKFAGRKYSPAAAKQVAQELHEMHEGKLTIGRSDKKVTNPKQAIAIGLAEARRAGKKVPPNPNDLKK